MWQICSDHRVTHLGIAPTAIRSLMVHGHEPPAKHDLSALRILASSGEPWNTEPWKWFLTHAGGGRAPIINYSGGTEIGGGILGCFPTMPLTPNSFHGPIPGMVADVFSEDGRPVRGAVGELVITQPWPGMTQSLWGGDPSHNDDARYLATYWERFPGTWVHGDWAVIEEVDGETFWFIRGRSDDTINVAGKRVGPAEFESALGSHAKIKEAAAIAVPDDVKGDVVVVLAVAKDAIDEGEGLRAELFCNRRSHDGQIVAAEGNRIRRRSSQDAKSENHATRGASALPRARPRRSHRARQRRRARSDRPPALMERLTMASTTRKTRRAALHAARSRCDLS